MIEKEDNPRWLRTREVARLLNVSDSTVRSWLSRTKIDGFKVDGVVRVDRESIDRFVETHSYTARARNGRSSTLSRWRRSLRGVAR